MKPELKKLLILNAPYLLFVYLFDKIGQAVRLSPGADLSGKVLSLADGFSAAFTTPLPSLAPMDLLIGIVGAVLIRLAALAILIPSVVEKAAIYLFGAYLYNLRPIAIVRALKASQALGRAALTGRGGTPARLC